jgi:hypothetical protein
MGADRACPEIAHLASWIQNSRRLISLGEIMKALNVSDIFNAAQNIAAAVVYEALAPGWIVSFDRVDYAARLVLFGQSCQTLGLPSTSIQVDRIVKIITESGDGNTVLWDRIKPELIQLQVRWEEETSGSIAYHLNSTERSLYENPTKDWQDVLTAFPTALNDVQEMNRCFALSRYTGSVFHAMRILEPGLGALGKEFGIPTSMNTWKTIIDRLRKAVEARSIAEGARWSDRDFYSDVAAQVWFFKDAWRNHVMHARVTFDVETAPPIIEYTRRLMTQLATKLTE